MLTLTEVGDIETIKFDGFPLAHMHLKHETHTYLAAKERLLATWPDLDSDTLADTLEGITDLHEMIAAVVRSALVDEALVSGLRLRLDDMKERLSRLEIRGAKKRQLAFEAMSEAGLKKLEQEDFTASLRAGPLSLVIAAEDEIPQDYWIPQPPKLARQALLNALKQGNEIPGAVLSNPKPSLSVRTK
jgi:hypothetical protein